MRRAMRNMLVVAATAGIGYVTTVVAVPHVIMHVAMNRLSDDGRRINTFQFADRTTSASRAIVRPSPDLAYASCVYDLSDGPIVVEVPPTEGGGYVSVSVFAANTDNFAVVDSLANPRGIRFVLQEPGKRFHPRNIPVIYSPTRRGIILDRRLAPTLAEFASADKARRGDRCAPG